MRALLLTLAITLGTAGYASAQDAAPISDADFAPSPPTVPISDADFAPTPATENIDPSGWPSVDTAGGLGVVNPRIVSRRDDDRLIAALVTLGVGYVGTIALELPIELASRTCYATLYYSGCNGEPAWAVLPLAGPIAMLINANPDAGPVILGITLATAQLVGAILTIAALLDGVPAIESRDARRADATVRFIPGAPGADLGGASLGGVF